MQVRKILPLIGTLFLLCCSFVANSQVLTTNQDGEKIVVYSDGSWAYFDVLDQEEQEAIKESSKKLKKGKKKKTKKAKKEKKPKKEKKSKKKKTKKDKGNKKGKKSKDSSKKKKGQFSEAEEEMARQEAMQRADWAAMEESRTKNIKIQASQELSFTRQELTAAYSNTDISVKELDELDKKYKNQQAVLNNAAATHKEAENRLKKMEGMIDMKKSKRDKQLAQLNESQESAANEWTGDLTENSAVSKSDGSKKKDRKKEKPSSELNQDLIMKPPTSLCNLAYDGVDEFTGKRRWEMPKQEFFTHTSERLKPFFKEKNHITVEGYLSGASGNGGTYYLNLNIIILSEMAQREFGVLEKASILTLKLINGSNVKLFNTKTSTGSLDKVEKRVEYRAQYMINSDNLKSLKKSEIDKARIVWGTGYEDYEVYNLDFFVDQINCLEKNK